MKQLFFSFSIILGSFFNVKSQNVNILNQQVTLHTTSSSLSLNSVEYLAQVRENTVLQKLILSPFKLGNRQRSLWLKDFRVNLVQEGSLTTLGLAHGISWHSKKESKENVLTQVVGGANVTLFPNWGSPSRDEDRDGLSDNFYSVSKKSIALAYARVTSNRNQFFFHTVYEQERESAVENTREVTSVGYSAGFKRLIKLEKNGGVVPRGLYWGSVIEQVLPIENQGTLLNGNSYQLSIAAQLEIQFYSNLVVRTSLPFVVIEGNRDERGLGAVFQLFLAI